MFTRDPAPTTLDVSSVLSWTAEQLDRVERALKIFGKRQPFATAWSSSSGTPPALGNGTLRGAFAELGSLVVVTVELAMGSTTTYGTGPWTFKLPRRPVAAEPRWFGSAWFLDGSTNYVGVVRTDLTLQDRVILSGHNGADVAATVPFTWANGDRLGFTIGYSLQ